MSLLYAKCQSGKAPHFINVKININLSDVVINHFTNIWFKS